MPIEWPANLLPKPTRNYNFSVSNSTIRTKFESGRSRQRRRFTKDFRAINIQWSFTDPQFFLFESFVKETLLNGQEWFEVDILQGDGFKTFLTRFVGGTYKAAYDDVMFWNVSAMVEVENPQLLTPEEIEFLTLLDDGLDDFPTLMSFHTLIHETLPELL